VDGKPAVVKGSALVYYGITEDGVSGSCLYLMSGSKATATQRAVLQLTPREVMQARQGGMQGGTWSMLKIRRRRTSKMGNSGGVLEARRDGA